MADKVLYEQFRSYGELAEILRVRKNNHAMRGQTSSMSGDYQFTHTHSYEEAEKILQNGYLEVVNKM